MVAVCAISAALAARATQPRAARTALYRCAAAPLVAEIRARGESLTLDVRRPLALRVVGGGAPTVELPVHEDAHAVIAALRVLDATRALPSLSSVDLARHGLTRHDLTQHGVARRSVDRYDLRRGRDAEGASVLTLRCGAERESLELGAHVSRAGERVVRRLRDGRAFVVYDDTLRRLEHADVLLAARAVWPMSADSVIAVRVELPGAPAVSLDRVADGTETRRFRSRDTDVPEHLATTLAESCLGLRAVNTRATRPPTARLVAALALRSADEIAGLRLWCEAESDAPCLAETAISHSHLFVVPRENAEEIVERATATRNPP